MDDLKLYILPCREPLNEHCYDLYNKSYELWKLIWSDTLKELDGVDKLYSNEFTRFDFATVITKNENPISLMCYGEVDMKLKARHEDSWFSCWPQDLLRAQTDREGISLIAAWFCTHPEFRKSHKKYNISELIIQSFGKIVLDGGYNVGYGVTRNNRSVGKYSQNAGSIVVGNTVSHNCEVDLVLFEPEILQLKQAEYSQVLQELWNKRIDLRMRNTKESVNEKRIRKAA